jgi:MFS family permease
MLDQMLPSSGTNFRRGWVYLFMLTLVMINYIDRSALAIVAQSIRAEFNLSAVDLGYLFSSFLWSYVICLLPVGILLDRFSPRAVNSAGIALWSLAIAGTAIASSFGSLLAIRIVMGAGEATTIPSCGRIVREWMPARERGVASTFYSAGGFLGPALGAIAVAGMAAYWGWRAAFLVLGILGFVWLACNLLWFDRPERVSWLSSEERNKILSERSAGSIDDINAPGSSSVMFELMRSKSMWGTMIAQAAGTYSIYLLLFWLPSYLQTSKHLTVMQTGVYTAIPWAIAVPVSVAIGFLSDRVMTRDKLLMGYRRFVVIACLLLAACMILAPLTDNTALLLALFSISLSGVNATISLNAALLTDLVHRSRDVGKAISLLVLSGNIFGLLAPIITGYVVATLGQYDWAFVIAGSLLICGAVALAIMTGKVILPTSNGATSGS